MNTITNSIVMEELDVSRCYIKRITYQEAKYLVETFHYAHRVPSIVFAIGIYVDNILSGVATFGIPPVPNVQRLCGEEYRKNTLELNRLYIHDYAGRNSESWLIGQSIKWLKNNQDKYLILVSYADTTHGHTGIIYQATNWIYTGEIPRRRVGYIINNHEYHNKALYNIIGSDTPKNVLNKFPEAKPVYNLKKHRYVYFLGDRRKNKELKSKLKWSVFPYPNKMQK